MKVLKGIIIAVVALAIVGGLGFYKYINTVTYYNEPDTNGNTIGNLYGNGLFCEYDGVVYFANPNDYDRLYKMNPDETDIEKVANDSVYYINADSHYLYYSRNNNKDNADFVLDVNTESLCRMTKRNRKIMILDNENCNVTALAGNRVLYLRYDPDEATTLYSVSIDGKEKEQISKIAIDPRCMVGEKLYFAGVERDHNLHKLNLDTKDESFVSQENLWLPIIDRDTLYYINLDDHHRVYTSTLSGENKKSVTSYGATSYNFAGNYLYYQSLKGNPDGLYRVDLITGAEVLIAEGQFNNINITSKYVYFADYKSGTTFQIINGSTEVGLFNPPILEVK